MPGITRRELRSLGINNTLTIDSSAELNTMLDKAKDPSIVETFMINPYASDINTSNQEGSKLHLKMTEEFPKKEKLHVSISNGPK